jgi:hypothetical protein
LAAVCARGQTPGPPAAPTTPVAVENTNAGFTPTNVNIPQASPSRPTVTGPAHIPPTGYLQFEQGFNRADGSPSGVSGQSALNQTTKIALTTRLLVQFISQPYTYNETDASPSTSDPGDLDLGGQYIVHKSVGSLPVIALGYIRRVRTGTSANLDNGDFSQSALALLSGDFPGNFHYDANLILNEQSSDENSSSATHTTRRGQFAQTFALSYPLFPKATANRLTGTAELSHFSQPFVSTPPVARSNTLGLLFAAGFTVRPNIVLDASFDHGLTSTSTQWQGGVGITYLLPHRLWPDRHPVPKPAGPFKYRNPR